MHDWLAKALLGVVEGITEFLPVSSTGHLLLAEAALPRQSDLFNVVIQSGAVLAVGVVFAERLGELWRRRAEAATQAYVGQLALAFAVTAAGGLVLKHLGLKLPETTLPVAWATLLGGIAFLVAEWGLARRPPPTQSAFSWPLAVGTGLMQLLAAVFPGTSRSGATILLALLAGRTRPAAAEFSFLLGIPTLLAAGLLKVVEAARAGELAGEQGGLWVGTLTAAACAFATVRWLLGFVRQHSFAAFGWYRVGLGALLLWWGT